MSLLLLDCQINNKLKNLKTQKLNIQYSIFNKLF
jgi:hypothetical protein